MLTTQKMGDRQDRHQHRRREDDRPKQLHDGLSGHLVPPRFV
jgi:hypothetical protein